MTKNNQTTTEAIRINGFSRYEITRDGQITSYVYKQPRIIKIRLNNNGYYWTWLTNDDKETKFCFIHRLVARQFVPNPDNKPVVNHIDGNPLNNHYTNLEWVTLSENQYHSYRIGLSTPLKGSRHPRVKLTDEDVLRIRRLYVPRKYSERKLAREYGVNTTTIHAIVTRFLWKHI